MKSRYVRSEPGRREDISAALVSGIVAAGVGLVTFYFARLMLSREPIVRQASDRDRSDVRREDR